MLTLYQAEWCPFSHRVRMRLTELGVPFVARQVEADNAERDEVRRISGDDHIPVLVDEDGTVVTDAERIVAWLDERYEERPDVELHRARARADMQVVRWR